MTKYQPSYWNGKGKYQNEYERLRKVLVPNQGEAATPEGELLRMVSRLYYEIHNNGRD